MTQEMRTNRRVGPERHYRGRSKSQRVGCLEAREGRRVKPGEGRIKSWPMGVAAEAPRCFEVERGLDRQYRQLHGIAGWGGLLWENREGARPEGNSHPLCNWPSEGLSTVSTYYVLGTLQSEHLLCARYSMHWWRCVLPTVRKDVLVWLFGEESQGFRRWQKRSWNVNPVCLAA
jgi:hypothetical protein